MISSFILGIFRWAPLTVLLNLACEIPVNIYKAIITYTGVSPLQHTVSLSEIHEVITTYPGINFMSPLQHIPE